VIHAFREPTRVPLEWIYLGTFPALGMCLTAHCPRMMNARVHDDVYKFQVPARVYKNWWSREDLRQPQVRDDYELLWVFLRGDVSSDWTLGLNVSCVLEAKLPGFWVGEVMRSATVPFTLDAEQAGRLRWSGFLGHAAWL
jgi:hypothetical protein